MMLFDPEVGLSIKAGNVAGRQGEGREINECYSKTKENWRPEEGHLAPEVKTANEIACDYVWDKLLPYPPPPFL
jgi:hypothetical protein